ncbi:MAG: Lrp/AsnC family transcriptional regulator [Streptosporangiaceae bacterium]
MSTPSRMRRRSRSAAPAREAAATADDSAVAESQVTGGHVALGPVVGDTVIRTTAGGRSRGQVLDEIDRRVIKILQTDGRRPNTEIARDLHVSETTIRKRVSQLVSQGLINIVAVPTPRAVGLNLSAIIGISVTLPKLKEISEELKRQKEVRYVGVSTGRYDIIVEAFFLDQQHFLDFISSKLSSMEGITGLETSMILDVVKFSYEWEIA